MKLKDLVKTTREQREKLNFSYSQVATEMRTLDTRTLKRLITPERIGVDLITKERESISLQLYNDILWGRQDQDLEDLSGYEVRGLDAKFK